MAIDTSMRYAGAISILSAAQNKPGQFTPKSNVAQQIQATLDAAKVQASYQQYYSGIANQLEGMRQGAVTPTEDWELTAGYYQDNGVPFRVSIGDDGKPLITAQADDDFKGKSAVQKNQLLKAVESLNDIFSASDELQTKMSLNYKLAQAADSLTNIEDYYGIPKANWEFEAQRYMREGTPFQISLDANGNVTTVNQSKELFFDRPILERLKLQKAVSDWNQIQAGTKTATELWQFEAMGHKSEGTNFFFDIGDDGKIDIKRNSYKNILPEFLDVTSDAVKTDFSWQQDALDLYKEGKGFYLDFDGSGKNIIVRENNYVNIAGLTDPTKMRNVQMAGLVSLLT